MSTDTDTNTSHDPRGRAESITATPQTDGTHTTTDLKDELLAALESLWAVVTFDLWGPKETNHGGACLAKIRVEHEDAPATVRATPIDPVRRTAATRGRRVYRAHKITKRVDGGRFRRVRNRFTDDTGECDRLREAMDAVVVATRAFDRRYGMFHDVGEDEGAEGGERV